MQVQAMGVALLLAMVNGSATSIETELPSLLPRVLLLMTIEVLVCNLRRHCNLR